MAPSAPSKTSTTSEAPKATKNREKEPPGIDGAPGGSIADQLAEGTVSERPGSGDSTPGRSNVPGSLNAAAVPPELRALDQWVLWRTEDRSGKPTKVPYTLPPGRGRDPKPASVTDPKSYMTFPRAVEAADAGLADGIGFVFTGADPYCGVDLDACVREDRSLEPDAAAILRDLGGYQERSPSGSGVHAIVRATLPDGARNRAPGPWGGGIEVYDRGRYFTVTGEGEGAPTDAAASLDRVRTQYLPRDAPAGEFDWSAPPPDGVGFDGDDAALLDRAREAANGDKFIALYDRGEHDYPSGSEADLALCGMLGFWTGPDPLRIERLFRASALIDRKGAKWERDDYRARTIAKALRGRDDYFRDSERVSDPSAPRGLFPQTTPSESVRARAYPRETHARTEQKPHEQADSERESVHGAHARSPDGLPTPRLASVILAETPEVPDWLVAGFVARGWTVKVAGREKHAGKGTHVAYLIGRLERGEATIYGPATESVTTLVLTEEPEDSFREKLAAFKIERARVVYGWQLARLTWAEKVAYLVSEATNHGCGLIFADNVSRSAGIEEESGTELARAIEQLSDAAKAADLAVIVDHHHRKSHGPLEDKSRGGTAAAGACENNVEIERLGDWTSRRRRISSFGRVRATCWQRVVELTEDGREYVEIDESEEPDADPHDRFLASRAAILAEYGETGASAQTFAARLDIDESSARRTLRALVEEARATVDEDARPKVYVARDTPVQPKF